MKRTRRACAHCHDFFLPKRNPQQYFCSKRDCQNARKRMWRKQKHEQDADYRQNQQRANKQWQERNKDYWRRYRKTHSDYAQRNREQQRIRRQKWRQLRRDTQDISGFAKSDALLVPETTKTPIKAGIYRLIPNTESGFAKSDALIVTITVVARV